MGKFGSGDTSWFVRERFGMFIHWGLYSMPARHEWVRHNEKITNEEYQKYFEHFNPDLFNPKEWAKAAREAGMRYFVITTKHHEGFCMWDSKYTDYKVTNTPCGRDLLREVVDAFRAEGIHVGFYYSLIDWHHPDFIIDNRIGPYRELSEEERKKMNEGRDMKRYAQYMRNQVRELLTEYGKIDLLWFDGGMPEGYVYPLEKIRKLQPGIVVNPRLHGTGDFETCEVKEAESRPAGWWEYCTMWMALWRKWNSRPDPCRPDSEGGECGGDPACASEGGGGLLQRSRGAVFAGVSGVARVRSDLDF